MTTIGLTGGQVLLPDGSVRETGVLVDDETGTIVEVGDVAGEETLSAAGGLVMPGLVNAHTHAAMTLFRGLADDKPLDAWLSEDIWPVEAELTGADVRAGTDLAMAEMIRSGTTCFADMYFFMPEVAEAVDDAGLRALLGYGMITADEDEAEATAEVETGVSFAAEYDGTADGRVRTALMPHGLYTVAGEHLETVRDRAADLGLPIHTHLAETGAEVEDVAEMQGARPVEAAADLGLLSPETYVAHGVHVTDEEVDRLADSGTGVAHCPASNMKLASGMAPVQTMLDAGVRVGLGTDGAGSNNDLDMFGEIRDAAMLGKLAAGDASAVDAATAVDMATAGSASLLGVDAGRIEPGAKADLIVVDVDAAHLTPHHDLVSHLAYAVKGSDVRHTVCDGRVLMRDRDLLTLDEDRVLERAESRARDLFARASE